MKVCKKILAVLTSVIIAFCASCSTVPVKAASYAMTAQGLEELAVILTSLYETVLIGSGAYDSFDNYDKLQSFWDNLPGIVSNMIGMPNVTGSDKMIDLVNAEGQKVTITFEDFQNLLKNESTALKLPTSDRFARYRVIDGGGGSEDPEGDNNNRFENFRAMICSQGLVAGLAYYVRDLLSGDEAYNYYPQTVEGLTQYYWNGNYYLEGDKIFIKGSGISKVFDNGDYYKYDLMAKRNILTKPCAYYDKSINGIIIYYNNSGALGPCDLGYKRYSYFENSSHPYATSEGSTFAFYDMKSFSLNIPYFSSYEAAENYMRTGTVEGLLNGQCYDFPGLAESAPYTLAPVPNVWLNPDGLYRLNHLLADAAAGYQPVPDGDPATNNQGYQQVVTATLTDNMPVADPGVDPEASPGPSASPIPGIDDGQITTDPTTDTYAIDLTQLFPFCLPFDLIRILDKLNAKPEAPVFEYPLKIDALKIDMVIKIDLSIFDEVMVIFRLGMTGLFVIGLIKVTQTVIKW